LYYFPQDPPYFLLLAGIFIGITCGVAFSDTLKQNVARWKVDRRNLKLEGTDDITLRLPFLGMAIGIVIFLSAGLDIFGFPSWLSFSISVPMTIFIAVLLWFQLKVVFRQLDRGGSPALDLDAWEE
jgi:uncharacterized membrane protein YhdT